MVCVEKLWDIGFRTLSSASLAADMALRKIWNFGKRIIVCWWPEYHGMAVDNIWDCYNTSWSLLLTSRHGGWPSREGWEGEKAKGGESHRVGKVQSSSISVHVFQFIHNIHTSYLYICTSSAWYTYISGTGGSSRFPSGLVSSSTGTVSSVQARWFCLLPEQKISIAKTHGPTGQG